jgi:hypothetical protein
VVYAGYALYSLTFTLLPAQLDELERKAKEIRAEAEGSGARSALFRAGQPLYWLVSLPLRAPLAALIVAFLLVLPAFILR